MNISHVEACIRQIHILLDGLGDGGYNEEPRTQQQLDAFWHQLNQLQYCNQVQICHLNYQGDDQLHDEYIELHNRGEISAELSGWTITSDSPDQVYVFPEGYQLPAGEKLKVFTQHSRELSFNSHKPIWNNKGDRAVLKNRDGVMTSGWRYGSSAGEAVVITGLNYDGKEERNEGDEFVELTNLDDCRIDLSLWQLCSERSGKTFTFEQGSILEPKQSIRLYTYKSPLEAGEFSFDSPVAIWNNLGGACCLLDAAGREVACYHY
ncbi:MAG: hypothetical protein CENE_01203 [Candidatus Celerinatantimonas neptuna]|nr:MAG: hypothetical protein CENE_01203 [Candidatus Celerinatantimonas neptuna]